MPIYIRFDGVDGSVRGAGNGGVWKTTNFLTNDPARRAGGGGGGHVKVFDGSAGAALADQNLLPVSRISLSENGGGVEGRDVAAKMKIEQLIRSAKSGGAMAKLYVATDTGVYQRTDAQGRLLVGSDQGVSRSGGAARLSHSNNLKQIGLGAHNTASVEIIITDAGGSVVGSHRLSNVSVTRSAGTFTLTFNGQTTGG